MSNLQVPVLEANLVLANTVSIGSNSVVNSSGIYISNSTAIINSSSIQIKAPYIIGNTANVVIDSSLSLDNISFTGNLMPYSDFSVSSTTEAANSWTRYNSNLTLYTGDTHPEGATVYNFTENADTVANSHFLYYDTLYPYSSHPDEVQFGTTYNCQIDVKANGREAFLIVPWGNYGAYFSVSNTSPYTLVGDVSNPKSSIKPLGNGWFRCFVSARMDNPSSLPSPTYCGIFPYIYLLNDALDRNSSYIGYGSSGILVSNFKCYKATMALETVNTQIFTANGTWTKPSWATTNNELVVVHMWGGGGGGASYSGGGGGAFVFGYFKSSLVNSTASVIVGGGGPSGSTTATNGGNSSFNANGTTILTAYGGGGANSLTSGGGGGWFSVGTIGVGGNPLGGAVPSGVSTFGGGGGATANNIPGGDSVYGGGGGGKANSSIGALSNGGNTVFGGGGGAGRQSQANGGFSIYGGKGGDLNSGPDAPGGGGAGTGTGGQDGARGEVRVYTYRVIL